MRPDGHARAGDDRPRHVFGSYEFWKKAKAHGVKPIIGMEGYLSPGSRHERKRVVLRGGNDADNPGEMYTHMALLAENIEGMHNLFRLFSLASLEGYSYKPRMDRELLVTYGKWIIATPAAPSARCSAFCSRTSSMPPARLPLTIETSSAGSEGGDQGRRPSALRPARLLSGGPDHQGDASASDGQGHPAERNLRCQPQALRRGH